MDDSLDMLPDHRLAQLLESPDAPPPWTSADGAAALLHQLRTPLMPDLAALPGIDETWLAATLDAWHQKSPPASAHNTPTTFEMLLTAEVPDESLLETVKNWARWTRDQPSTPLAGAPATVLYYAAIAAGITRLKKRLTSLNAEQLREGFNWAAAQPGAERLRQTLSLAASTVK